MAEKGWTKGGDRGVNNSSTVLKLTSGKLSEKDNKKRIKPNI